MYFLKFTLLQNERRKYFKTTGRDWWLFFSYHLTKHLKDGLIYMRDVQLSCLVHKIFEHGQRKNAF